METHFYAPMLRGEGVSLDDGWPQIQARDYCEPTPIANLGELIQRASVGPIPGELMLLGSILFNGAWITFAIVTLYLDRAKHGGKPIRVAMG